ncbi:MAG TPA: preprotein translocase subunit SecY [Thermoplasmatales archaeon]|nr:MAG: preprotein translocase subunit SecY [Thermoplasmata archaeon]RLF34271.1 MAG: preprotein translocase subunit SecY [Thermoplasmata archaeon]HDN51181.1 preprotein translocase subunit SecY [Thermoplasmatales archaeon]
MAEEKSKLYVFKPIVERWPAIKKPKGHVSFRTKILWTGVCLVLYYILTQILIYGLSPDSIDMFSGFRVVFAGASGSIMHLGIGPIVTASIILQLFVGAKLINLDLQDEEDRALYQGFQKVLVVVMILIEAVPQVFGYLQPSDGLINMAGMGGARAIIVAQLFVGAMIVFWMDEVISKWGIGSGISLFIAAGVSNAIVTGMLSWLPANQDLPLGVDNPPAGAIPKTVYLTQHLSIGEMVNGGGFEKIFITPPNPIIAVLGTIVIFLFVVYAESSRVELPLAHGRVRGARGRYPLRLMYSSNIPVILMSALMANLNMFGLLLYTRLSNIPGIGGAWWIGKYLPGSTQPSAGALWYLQRPNGLHTWLFPLIDPRYRGYLQDHEPWQLALRLLIYGIVFIVGCIFFGKFWIETTNMGPEAVARQIQSSGMQIPGFRRDPRIVKKVLERYIPALTVTSAALVGLLALFANLIGTVGNATGTGVLLTVGIVIRLYEDIAKEQTMEMHPVLRKFMGVE